MKRRMEWVAIPFLGRPWRSPPMLRTGPTRADLIRTGVSDETGLVSTWSPSGENVIWKADVSARATPVVFDGRVCLSGRSGEGPTRRELAACF